MMNLVTLLSVLTLTSYLIEASPVILKGSSPSGDAVIAISSSSDPEIAKYITFNYPPASGTSQRSDAVKNNPQDFFDRSFSFVTPGNAAAGSGRSYVSTSAFNPFPLPVFFMPIDLEGFRLNDAGSQNSWFKNIESLYDPSVAGNGELKTVTAVNENGHVYGKVKTVTFDNKVKSNANVKVVS